MRASREAASPREAESERRRRVDPDDDGQHVARVVPAVRARAGEGHRILRAQTVGVELVERELELTLQDVQELLALVRVGLLAAVPWFDADEDRLQRHLRRVQVLEDDARRLHRQDVALVGPDDELALWPWRVEE